MLTWFRKWRNWIASNAEENARCPLVLVSCWNTWSREFCHNVNECICAHHSMLLKKKSDHESLCNIKNKDKRLQPPAWSSQINSTILCCWNLRGRGEWIRTSGHPISRTTVGHWSALALSEDIKLGMNNRCVHLIPESIRNRIASIHLRVCVWETRHKSSASATVLVLVTACYQKRTQTWALHKNEIK